eukprot:10025391-Karenia_brevis.AAC.1
MTKPKYFYKLLMTTMDPKYFYKLHVSTEVHECATISCTAGGWFIYAQRFRLHTHVMPKAPWVSMRHTFVCVPFHSLDQRSRCEEGLHA